MSKTVSGYLALSHCLEMNSVQKEDRLVAVHPVEDRPKHTDPIS